MRIVHIVDQFDYCDGCARHVFFLARAQKESGHEVTIVAGRGDAFALLHREKLSFREIPFIHHATRSVTGFFRGAWMLRDLFASLKPDIVHCHHFYTANQARAFSRRCPIVLTLHANLPKGGLLPKCIGDMLIAVSKSTKTWALRNYPAFANKVIVIPNTSEFLGLDDEVRSSPKFQEFLKKKPGAFVVVYSGRLVKAKGVQNLIAAISRLKAEIPILFLVAGSGEKELELKVQASLLSVDTMFFGSVRDVRPLLEASDVVVLPSLSAEGMPMTIFEAGLLGRPIIASNTDGIPEMIQDGVSGMLVPPGDVDQLANALRRLYVEPQMRNRLGASLQERIKTNSIRNMADRVLSAYRGLARTD